MIHLDTNVIIDLLQSNTAIALRSARTLQTLPQKMITDVVYAELAAGFETRHALDLMLADIGVDVAAMSREALFVAGHAHFAYRRRGGPREHVLADFLIGAHALTVGCALLTRDPKRYKTAFPELQIIEP